MMNEKLEMTNGTPAGQSAGSFQTLPFASFDIRNSAFESRPIRRALIETDLVDCMVALECGLANTLILAN